ncbi:MAG: hypothetical protein ABW162_12075 [Candidatus Sedimenticola sp. PURPLELP]
MKFVTTALLLAPAIAMAAPQQDPTQDPKVFAQVKARMLPAMSESLPAMEETQACVSASKNSDDLNGCVAIMMSYQQKVMGGAAKPANVPGHKTPAPQAPKLTWSPKLKERILADLSTSIKNTNAAKGCLESSATHAEMSSCMDAAGIKRPQPPQR